MKKVEVVSQEHVTYSPFVLSTFNTPACTSVKNEKVTKKTVKSIAKELGIGFDENQLEFAKKVINVYLERMQ